MQTKVVYDHGLEKILKSSYGENQKKATKINDVDHQIKQGPGKFHIFSLLFSHVVLTLQCSVMFLVMSLLWIIVIIPKIKVAVEGLIQFPTVKEMEKETRKHVAENKTAKILEVCCSPLQKNHKMSDQDAVLPIYHNKSPLRSSLMKSSGEKRKGLRVSFADPPLST